MGVFLTAIVVLEQARFEWTWVFAAIVCTVFGGCGGGTRAPLEGTVTLDGTSLTDGEIMFLPIAKTGGGSSTGGRIVDGKFLITTDERVIPGRFRVEITATRKTGKQVRGPIGELLDEVQHIVPKQYNQQSKLTADVSARVPNRFEFALHSK